MRSAETLTAVIRRSIELHETLGLRLRDAAIDDSTRADLTLSTAQLALEHGGSIVMLVEAGNIASANVLLRTQLEATVRTAWLLYVASDEWIARYLESAQRNPRKDPGSAPGMDDMIRGIERKANEGLAPAALVPQLKTFKDGAWGPLNSFVHSGVHPITLQVTGYAIEGAIATIQNANGLSVVLAMLLAVLSGDLAVVANIRETHRAFLDCCPPVTPS